jgi:asparagine synthetase B (glutamine-hydrolysing)
MCGIAGITHRDQRASVNQDAVLAMTAALEHPARTAKASTFTARSGWATGDWRS